jgi:two-component system, cell cycle sensor histidine kinase and response regulator CckA
VNSLTILLVDDDADVRGYAREVLEMTGARVLEAADATAALAIAARTPTSIDLLLTDINMPGIDGVELAHRLRLLRPEIRVRYMSGSDPYELATRGVSCSRGDLIAKPFGVDGLLEGVCRALGVARRFDWFGWNASNGKSA